MKRILFVVLIIVLIPLFNLGSSQSPSPVVAWAGRNVMGQWCECGSPGCLCDPGEVPPGGLNLKKDDDVVSNDEDIPDVDPGLIVLAFVTAFFFWNRIRA